MELLGSSPIPRSFVTSCVRLYLRPLPSASITRLQRYCGPLRHPIRPGLSLASCRLIPTAITAGASRVASGLLCVHAVANIPAGSMELVRSSISIASGLPLEIVRSAPATIFSGPAQRLLTLRPARSRSRQATLYIESSDSFVASAAASIASGWSEPVPGREFHPLKSSAFHGARFRQFRIVLLQFFLLVLWFPCTPFPQAASSSELLNSTSAQANYDPSRRPILTIPI